MNMKNQIDEIIETAPAWIIGVVDKIKPGEKIQRLIDVDGRMITTDELKHLIAAADQVTGENITINVVWNNQEGN